jgi:hypothetical protein
MSILMRSGGYTNPYQTCRSRRTFSAGRMCPGNRVFSFVMGDPRVIILSKI